MGFHRKKSLQREKALFNNNVLPEFFYKSKKPGNKNTKNQEQNFDNLETIAKEQEHKKSRNHLLKSFTIRKAKYAQPSNNRAVTNNILTKKNILRYNSDWFRQNILLIMTRGSIFYLICFMIFFAFVCFALGATATIWFLKSDKQVMIIDANDKSMVASNNNLTKKTTLTDKLKTKTHKTGKKIFSKTITTESLIKNNSFPKAKDLADNITKIFKKDIIDKKLSPAKTRNLLYKCLHFSQHSKNHGKQNDFYSLKIAEAKNLKHVKFLIHSMKKLGFHTTYLHKKEKGNLYAIHLGEFKSRFLINLVRKYLLTKHLDTKIILWDGVS